MGNRIGTIVSTKTMIGLCRMFLVNHICRSFVNLAFAKKLHGSTPSIENTMAVLSHFFSWTLKNVDQCLERENVCQQHLVFLQSFINYDLSYFRTQNVWHRPQSCVKIFRHQVRVRRVNHGRRWDRHSRGLQRRPLWHHSRKVARGEHTGIKQYGHWWLLAPIRIIVYYYCLVKHAMSQVLEFSA